MYGVVRVFLQNRPCPRYMLRAPLTHTHRRPVLREFCAHRPDNSPEYTITRHSRQRATGPKRKKAVVRTPCPKACVSSSRLLLHTPRACPSIHVRRHYPIALHAPRSRLGRLRHNPSPQPAQHDDSTVHTTQTRPIVTPPDTHNTPSMMGMQAYAPPSLHRVHPTPLPPQLCLSFRALMDYQSPESP